MAAPAGVGIVLYVFCVLRVSNTTLGAESALSRCSLLMNTGESRDFGFVFAVDVGGTDLSSTLTSPDAPPWLGLDHTSIQVSRVGGRNGET